MIIDIKVIIVSNIFLISIKNSFIKSFFRWTLLFAVNFFNKYSLILKLKDFISFIPDKELMRI